jgi:hypothetical protein
MIEGLWTVSPEILRAICIDGRSAIFTVARFWALGQTGGSLDREYSILIPRIASPLLIRDKNRMR